MTSRRVTNLYHFSESLYEAPPILEQIRALGACRSSIATHAAMRN